MPPEAVSEAPGTRKACGCDPRTGGKWSTKAINKVSVFRQQCGAEVPGGRRDWSVGMSGQRYWQLDGVEANMKAQEEEVLLTPAEVAAMFRVDPKTVTRWAKAGKLSSIRTLGGHRRYRAAEVQRFLEGARQDGVAAAE